MEWTTVETSDGVKLNVRVFKPPTTTDADLNPTSPRDIAIVLVHPFTILGGSQGLLRGIAANLAEKGYTAVTFDSRGAGRSTGRASLTGFSEIQDVIAVCKWVGRSLNPNGGIVLVGSSAGAIVAKKNRKLLTTVENAEEHCGELLGNWLLRLSCSLCLLGLQYQ